MGVAGPARRHRRAHDQGRSLRRRRGRQGQRGPALPLAPGARDLHGRALRRLHLGRVPFAKAMLASIIIGVVTFSICIAGLFLGKRFGMKLADKATILGGVILIGIGLEIFFGA